MIRALPRLPYAAVCAAVLVGACSKGEKTADSARMSDSAMAAMPAAAPASAPMSDANIFASLDEANVADSTTGSIAATKGTSADVRAFGKEMMKDHHMLRKSGQDLAKKLNITPAPAPGDNSAAADKAFADSLTSMAKGADWDKFYVDRAVTHHAAVLTTAQNAMSATQNAELKAMLTKAAPIVQQHLDKAKALQAKLGGTASSGATNDSTRGTAK